MVAIAVTGIETLQQRMAQVSRAFRLTAQAFQRVGEAQRRRIIQRVERQGKDIHDRPFAPYSTKGPIYIYGDHARRLGRQSRGAAARRFAGITGGQRTRMGVKYASYAAYKRALGRKVVDLAGRSRRMLGQLVTARPTESSVTIGVFGEAAGRAAGHQRGSGYLPKRQWLGATKLEIAAVKAGISAEILRLAGHKQPNPQN